MANRKKAGDPVVDRPLVADATGPAEAVVPGVSRDAPRVIPVVGIEADPAPGEAKPEQPGLYVNANYHEQEHVPLLQTVSFTRQAIGGGATNVHGPGLVMVPQRAVQEAKARADSGDRDDDATPAT